MILSGKTISPGLARGVSHVIDARALLSSAMHLAAEGPPPSEVERLHAAVGHACVELDRVQRQLSGRVQASNIAIFASHTGLLRDSKFIGQIEQQIYEQGLSAEAAVARIVNDLYSMFMANPIRLMQDKASDLLDIGRRLIRCLSASQQTDLEVDRAAIIVAPSLTPSELVRFAHQGISGIITETCGVKSHTAILARGLAIPLITGVRSVCDAIPNDAEIVVDANRARVIIPSTQSERDMVDGLFADASRAEPAVQVVPVRPVTADGVPIQVLLNVSDPAEAAVVRELGAAGIGLFRTEFLYMDRRWWPSEDEGYEIYRGIAKALGSEAELNVRVVDFGAEKCPDYADIPLNRNPSLGLRGIRLLLQREDIFRPQVRAIARLAAQRPVTLLFPMLDTLETLQFTLEKLCQFIGVQSAKELPFQIGAMIEVPAAALMIEDLLPHVDSVAIGLNDLTQYTLAADRDDEFVEKYHDAMQPAVVRLVHRVIHACNTAGKPVSICGELAGDPNLTSLLLALGLRRFSVSRSSYASVVAGLAQISLEKLTPQCSALLKLSTAAAIRSSLNDSIGQR